MNKAGLRKFVKNYIKVSFEYNPECLGDSLESWVDAINDSLRLEDLNLSEDLEDKVESYTGFYLDYFKKPDRREKYLDRHNLKQFKINAKEPDIKAFKKVQADKGFKSSYETLGYLLTLT